MSAKVSIHATRLLRHSLHCTISLLLLLMTFSTSLAQGGGGVESTGTGGRHVITGRIFFPSGMPADVRMKVKLESTSYSDMSVIADLDGNFAFRALLPGSYTVVVEGGKEYETYRETIFIDGEVSPRRGLSMPSVARSYQVQAHLKVKPVAGAKPGVINAAMASVPEPARKYYEKGLEFAQNGDGAKAIEQLKQAVSYHPAFALAWNELGVQYMKLGQMDPAIDALKAALKLEPAAFVPRLNYGIALLQKKRFTEARSELQEALKRNPNSASAHLYLGITLINDKQFGEAEEAFLKSLSLDQNMGLAHYYLGGLYWRKGEHKLAADSLEKYLQLAPNAAEAEKIKATIKELRAKR